MKLKIGAGLHWADDWSIGELIKKIQHIEDLQYDQIWISNEKFFHDMYITATAAALNTNKIMIGTFVVDPYSHHPALTAASVATLDKISHGRAILGIGAGGTGFPVMGIQRKKPATAIKEAIHIIRGLWTGETVDYKGQVVQCNNGKLNFQVEQQIPIVVASRGDLVLQTGGEVADGVMIASYAEPEGLKHALLQVQLGADKTGRSMDELRIIARIDTCINDDWKLAYDAVRPMVAIMLWTSYPDRKFVQRVGLEVPQALESIIAMRDYNLVLKNSHLVPDSFVDKFCWAGTKESVIEKVSKAVSLGISNITILPHATAGSDILATLQAFALDVKPMVLSRM